MTRAKNKIKPLPSDVEKYIKKIANRGRREDARVLAAWPHGRMAAWPHQ